MRKLAVVMMVSAPKESEWMITLSWIDCLDIHISAALTACSSAKVIKVWFGILLLISLFISLKKQAQTAFTLS